MANKNLLNFPQTCPKIDRALTDIHNRIEIQIDSLIDEFNNLCILKFGDTDDVHDLKTGTGILCDTYVMALYDDVSEHFETVRETNSDLRETAENQLAGLHNEIDDLQNEIGDLQHEIDNLKNEMSSMHYNSQQTIDGLQNEINDLRYQISCNNNRY